MSDHYPGTFEGLLALVERLRGPSGCPWDQEQARASMRRYVLEECYELVEAIDSENAERILDELGDVLFHLALQVQFGKELGEFTEEQVMGRQIEKLVRRHPHVFGDSQASNAREVEAQWQVLKQREREDGGASLLGEVPRAMPALSYAHAIQERAARVGFGWDDVGGVIDKVREELDELQSAETPAAREAELGDVMFALVNLGRWLGIDAESAVRTAGSRFRDRFTMMERLSGDRGLPFEGLSLAEREALWQEAKGILEQAGPG